MPSFARLRLYLPLIKEMVRRELRGRYAGSALGFFWSVIHPLMQLVIFTLVFGLLMGIRLGGAGKSVSGFALYLFCGLLPWNGFSETMNRGATSLLENANLIKNLNFPAKIIQIAIALNALLHQCLGLAILLVISAWIHRGFYSASLLIPPLLALQFLFMLGVALLLAPLAVSFRDLLQLLPVINMVWLYVTPMFYPEELAVNKGLGLMLTLNPMRYFVTMSRMMLLDGRLPGLADWAAISAMSLFTFLLGFTFYTRRHSRFADEL
jgi:ABC-type polysaccharide/polyol phosphate export permease